MGRKWLAVHGGSLGKCGDSGRAFSQMRDYLPSDRPLLVLAPMQDITDLAFMRVMEATGGGPDVYVTEYFRVHDDSTLEKDILRSVVENATGKPVFAQMIGQSIPALVRNARLLEESGAAGVDLNLGCPAPIVCRKTAGGGLLRQLDHLDAILGALREAIGGRFTVKTRLGYHSVSEFEALLEIFSRHAMDALTIHGRTVAERYRTPIHPEWIRRAVDLMPCPVIANGNVVSVETGAALWRRTGAAGLMIGRGAIRNPWLFAQLRAHWEARTHPPPTFEELYHYIRLLYEETKHPTRYDEGKHVQKMKKYMIFIAQGIDPDGTFEHQIRRVTAPEAFWEICERFLLERADNMLGQPPAQSSIFCGFEALLNEPAIVR